MWAYYSDIWVRIYFSAVETTLHFNYKIMVILPQAASVKMSFLGCGKSTPTLLVAAQATFRCVINKLINYLQYFVTILVMVEDIEQSMNCY